jgi:alcohol dehydrogenase class IV
MARRAPEAMAAFSRALGDETVAKLAARSGHTRLSTLGVEESQLPEVVKAALPHPGIAATPDPPGEEELLDLLGAAL